MFNIRKYYIIIYQMSRHFIRTLLIYCLITFQNNYLWINNFIRPRAARYNAYHW